MKNEYAILQNKCLGLIDPFGDYSNCVFEVYSDDSIYLQIVVFLFKIFRKLHIIREIPQSIYWNTKWKCKSKQINNWIIFFDNSYAIPIVKYLKKRNLNVRCFFYSWDIHFIPPKQIDFVDGIGTFDPIQSKKYGIDFYSQFYSFKNSWIPILQKRKCIYGGGYKFVFLGLKKGREKEIMNVKKMCDKVNTNSFFRIVDSQYSNSISYLDYLTIILTSDCIIDIVQSGQKGFTLRTMEALFFRKKLITNNAYVRTLDFYDPANIYIYGMDSDLEAFMFRPMALVSDNICRRYTFDNFVKRIISKENDNV